MSTHVDAPRPAFPLEHDLLRDLPRYAGRPPFHYISTGTETLFTRRRDAIRRPREVFHFHRPETLAAWAAEPTPYPAQAESLGGLQLTVVHFGGD